MMLLGVIWGILGMAFCALHLRELFREGLDHMNDKIDGQPRKSGYVYKEDYE